MRYSYALLCRGADVAEAVKAAASCSGDKTQEVRDASGKLIALLCEVGSLSGTLVLGLGRLQGCTAGACQTASPFTTCC